MTACCGYLQSLLKVSPSVGGYSAPFAVWCLLSLCSNLFQTFWTVGGLCYLCPSICTTVLASVLECLLSLTGVCMCECGSFCVEFTRFFSPDQPPSKLTLQSAHTRTDLSFRQTQQSPLWWMWTPSATTVFFSLLNISSLTQMPPCSWHWRLCFASSCAIFAPVPSILLPNMSLFFLFSFLSSYCAQTLVYSRIRKIL